MFTQKLKNERLQFAYYNRQKISISLLLDKDLEKAPTVALFRYWGYSLVLWWKGSSCTNVAWLRSLIQGHLSWNLLLVFLEDFLPSSQFLLLRRVVWIQMFYFVLFLCFFSVKKFLISPVDRWLKQRQNTWKIG